MQYANIMLALGGDNANVIPKYGCSAAEIAVLMAIHGEQAVSSVEPLEDKQISHRAELDRLLANYGNAKDSENRSIVKNLYPGAGARLHENLADLELVEDQFKAEKRVAIPARSASKPSAVGKADQPEAEELEELEGDDDFVEEEGDSGDLNFVDHTIAELKEYIGDDAEIPKAAKKDDLIAIAVEVQQKRAAEGKTENLFE